MTTATVARPSQSYGAHWYSRDGKPMHFVEKKDGTGTRPTTLADARKLDLLPSVTTILKCLSAPALEAWKTEMAVLACLTTPRLENEPLDLFINRVLNVEKQQDQESDAARQLGTNIHDAIEQALQGGTYDAQFDDYVAPVIGSLTALGRVVATEKVLVGVSYAGKTDCICESDHAITLLDFKTTKRPPKEAYPEHRLQLAAYAAALGNTGGKRIRTVNIYISTTEPGQIAICANPDWVETFQRGFKPILDYWYWRNGLDRNGELKAAA